MKITRAYRKALIVLNILEDLLENEEIDIHVSCYQNCREQGFEVTSYKEYIECTVTFSENRNSDDIVVYLENNEGQAISEKAYSTRKYFKDYMEAAEYCKDHLLNGRRSE